MGMCRMLAVIGNPPITEDLVLRFRCLSIHGNVKRGAKPGHEDGWGIASYRNGSPKYLGRSTEPAWRDPRYEAACGEITSADRITLVHLRKASSGSKSPENTQPLVSGKWSLGHNGTIYSPSFSRSNHRSDSMILLERLVKAIEGRENSPQIESTIADGVKRIRQAIQNNPSAEGRTYSSLTFMLSDGESVYVLRDYEADEDRDYYTMFYCNVSGGVIFCQERIWNASWKSLENKQLALVNRDGTIVLKSCQ